MQLSIFPNKKASIAGRKVIFYIYAAIAIAISFLFLVWIVPTSKSEIAIIPPNLENYLVSQRFFSSPECFAFQDEIPDEVHPRMIDLEKFNEDSLNSCYDAINTDVKAYQLTLNYDGIPEIPVPTDFSSPCNDICGSIGKGCIMAVDNGNYKECDDNTQSFEGNDDYCICGSGSERVIPVPDNIPSSDPNSACNNICRNIGKGCIIAVDDGGDKECDDNTQSFEGNDDYCLCGRDSKEVTPVPDDYSDTCNNICTLGNCIMGVNNGNDDKKCSEPFSFEENDDYCICGTGSAQITPTSCNVICGTIGITCEEGIDDGGKWRGCDERFGFEDDKTPDDYCKCSGGLDIYPRTCDILCADRGCIAGINNGNDNKKCGDILTIEGDGPIDDYCICGSGSKEVTPVPNDYDSVCNTICSNIDKGCILGEENEDTKKCSESIEFGESDDFCICAEKRIINTQNWEGFLEKGETSQIVVYDAGVMQRGNLLIEVQNAK